MTQTPSFQIQPAEPCEFAECEAVLRSLPDWFGIEESLVEYVESLERMPVFAARSAPGKEGPIAGFLSVNRHFPASAEIHVMGVRKEHHRSGVGRALVEHVEAWLRADGCEYLQVKTLSPATGCPFYAKTRRFYEGVGFRPLEEMRTLWGEDNPCQVYVKRI